MAWSRGREALLQPENSGSYLLGWLPDVTAAWCSRYIASSMSDLGAPLFECPCFARNVVSFLRMIFWISQQGQ